MSRSPNRLMKPLSPRFSDVADLLTLVRDRKAAVSVMFAVSLIALVPAIGIAVDFGRIVTFKSALQNAADSAALAGASAYTDTTMQSTAVTTANNYMNRAIAGLPSNNGVTVTPPVTGTLTSLGSTTGFTVKVAATGSINTTIMSAVMKTVTVSVTATAENPILIVNIAKSQFSSDASDRNLVYAYAIPLDNSLPKSSDLKLIADNASTSNPTQVQVKLAASQNMGFALRNITGGKNGYGKNSYAAPQNSTNTFYSQSTQVSLNTTQTDSTSKAKYAANTKNCSLISSDVGSGTAGQSSTAGAPTTGSCSSTTPGQYTQNMKLDCTKNHGETIRYYWNDMGGPTSDDKDYNDMIYNVTCPDNSSAPHGVSLIQ